MTRTTRSRRAGVLAVVAVAAAAAPRRVSGSPPSARAGSSSGVAVVG